MTKPMGLQEKPTLEELLKLKRAERPTEAEWSKFDAELKSKMLCRLVGERGDGDKRASLFGRGTVFAYAAAVFCAAVFAGAYSDFFGAIDADLSASGGLAECTPLPNLTQSFADNVLAADSSSTESPVVAPMNFNGGGAIRYVSSGVVRADTSAF